MLTQKLFVNIRSNQLDGKSTCILLGLRLVMTFASANVHTVKVNFAKMLKSAFINFSKKNRYFRVSKAYSNTKFGLS